MARATVFFFQPLNLVPCPILIGLSHKCEVKVSYGYVDAVWLMRRSHLDTPLQHMGGSWNRATPPNHQFSLYFPWHKPSIYGNPHITTKLQGHLRQCPNARRSMRRRSLPSSWSNSFSTYLSEFWRKFQSDWIPIGLYGFHKIGVPQNWSKWMVFFMYNPMKTCMI